MKTRNDSAPHNSINFSIRNFVALLVIVTAYPIISLLLELSYETIELAVVFLEVNLILTVCVIAALRVIWKIETQGNFLKITFLFGIRRMVIAIDNIEAIHTYGVLGNVFSRFRIHVFSRSKPINAGVIEARLEGNFEFNQLVQDSGIRVDYTKPEPRKIIVD